MGEGGGHFGRRDGWLGRRVMGEAGVALARGARWCGNSGRDAGGNAGDGPALCGLGVRRGDDVHGRGTSVILVMRPGDCMEAVHRIENRMMRVIGARIWVALGLLVGTAAAVAAQGPEAPK